MDAKRMSSPAKYRIDIAELGPRTAAAKLAAAHQDERGWLDEFAVYLDRHRAGQSLARILGVWDLNQSQAASLFGVSRQALNKWLEHGVPAERTEAVADLSRATDVLVRYLKRDRIPAVVRRPVGALKNRSLKDLFSAGETGALLEACRDMFQFDRAQD
jgi:DNA-binding transcriptional regulator YdaS (Cro superfamily)